MRLDFLHTLAQHGEQSALVAQDTTYTYAEILTSMSAFNLATIPPHSVVALQGDYSLESCAAFLALYARGCIIAPLLPRNVDFMLENFGIEYVLEAQSKAITPLSPSTFPLLERLKASKQSGLILFSSGSTGKPKAVVHSLDKLIHSYHQKKRHRLRILSVYLPDHIAGIDVMLGTFASGGVLIVPQAREPQHIINALIKHRVEILPASPTLLRLLLFAGLAEYDLRDLRLVVYGSEAMNPKLLESLAHALPHARFKQSFGTSETSAIQTKQPSQQGLSGFFQILNASYKVKENSLYLKSPTNALGYLNSDNSVFDEEGYFATGDLVEVAHINGEEYIKIIGRAKEVINVGGEKVLPQEVEGVILELECVEDCLVYGEANSITGQSVSVKVVLDSKYMESLSSNIELKKHIRAFCKERLAPFKIPSKVLRVEALEVSERFKRRRK